LLAAVFLLLSLTIFAGQYFIDGRRIDIFDPKNLFQVYFIIQLPLVLFIGVTFDFPGFLVLSLKTADDEILSLGSMFLMAHVTMLISYYTMGRKWLPLPVVGSIRWDYRRVKAICALIFIIGYTAFFYLLKINGGYANFVENRELWRSGGDGWRRASR